MMGIILVACVGEEHDRGDTLISCHTSLPLDAAGHSEFNGHDAQLLHFRYLAPRMQENGQSARASHGKDGMRSIRM